MGTGVPVARCALTRTRGCPLHPHLGAGHSADLQWPEPPIYSNWTDSHFLYQTFKKCVIGLCPSSLLFFSED